jgi:hypothetical protein
MDGKNALVAVLVAVVAILTASTKTGGSKAAAPAATDKAGAREPGAKEPGGKPAGAKAAPKEARTATPSSHPACDAFPVVAAADDPICQLQRDFPGTFAGCGDSSRPRPDGAAPVRVLLATLPSPLVPALLSEFDRGLEAIERAVQSQRYVLQRQWLPWREAAAGKPGWMLFRRDNERAPGEVTVELLLVLVVSERPESGIEPDELKGALSTFQSIDATQPAMHLVLLGPYFSGTAQSLVQQTAAWCGACGAGFCSGRSLIAVSGTATRRRTQPIIQGLEGVFQAATFHATVLPDDRLVAGMHRFIEERLGIEAKEIADLTETSTDYGNAVATDEGAKQARTPNGSKPGVAAGEPSLKIALPLHVDVLADRKEDDKTEPPEPAKSTGLELDATFATLSRNGVNHVGILATTTKDKVFLAGRLRKSAPNLRVHMYEGSIDLADPGRREALEGLMVASSYPVFATTQLWPRVQTGALLQFQSASAEGIYNAMLGLLSRLGAASSPAKLLDYASPFCNQRVAGPSVWISVSISGQLWPLAVYAPALAVADTTPEATKAACPALKAGEAPPSADPYLFVPQDPRQTQEGPRAETNPGPLPVQASFLIMIGVAFVLLLIAGNLVGLLPVQPAAGWRTVLVSYARTGEKGASPLPADGARHSVAMLALWALAVTALTMGKVLDLPRSLAATAVPNPFLHAMALALVWSAFALVVSACVLAAVRSRGAGGDRRMSAGIQAGMCGVMLLAIWLCPFDELVRHPDGHAYFFFVRATDPGVGLTPTIPLFMVGMAIYGASLLRLMVIRRADSLTAEAKLWNPDPPRSFAKCATTMSDFARAASRSLLPVCVAGTAFGFLVLYVTPMRLGSLEGRGFDMGCSVCFSLAFTLTLAAAWRAHSLWYRLRDFTRALASHPAAKAMTRLPASVPQRFRSPVPGQVGNQQIDIAVAMKLHEMNLASAPAIADLVLELDKRWFPHGAEAAKVAQALAAAKAPPEPQGSKEAQEEVAKLQEDYLALHMVTALGLMCDATRSMLFIATGTGLIALLGCALYPFQPAATLTGAGLVSVGLVVVIALRVLLGIEKDKVLSDVAGTTADKITPSLGLFTRLVGYVIVPLGGLIGSRLQDPGAVIDLLKNLTNALNR